MKRDEPRRVPKVILDPEILLVVLLRSFKMLSVHDRKRIVAAINSMYGEGK